jgi:hypothetical protein
MNDPVLVVGYMVAVSLTADFVARRDAGFAAGVGSPAALARTLAVRPMVGGVLMLPAWLVFGAPGLLALILVALPQGYLGSVMRSRGRWPFVPAEEWSPVPAAMVLAGQAVKAAFIGAAWLALREAPINSWIADNVLNPHPGVYDAVVRWGSLAAVAWSLLVVNTRAGSFLVSLLLPPDVGEAEAGAARGGYAVRLGPLSGRIEPDGPRVGREPDAVGATVGGIERLLVVMLVLARAEVAIGLVVAAKTLARFKQLDERHFAERYLIGTLASITIAIGSALLARYALGL